MNFRKKGTVIIISNIHWHTTWQRHQNIASGLSQKGYAVIFMEPLPKRWPLFSEMRRLVNRLMGRLEGAGTCAQREVAEVTLYSPILLPDVGDLAQAINRIFFVPGIVRRLESFGFMRPLVVVHYLPIPAAVELGKRLLPDLQIYDCISDWTQDPYASDLGQTERELIKEADLVLVDSLYNLGRLKKCHAHPLLHEVGADLDHFGKACRKEMKTKAAEPLCVYFGDIGVNTDIELLRKVSHRYPLRLIGPVRLKLEGFSKKTEICGPVFYERLPILLEDADVLLLPYKISSHNQSVLPAKTFECLATGKPTVTIGLPELERYADLFYLCSNHDEFMEAIEKAFQEDPKQARHRIDCAKRHSWIKKIEELDAWIESSLKQKGFS